MRAPDRMRRDGWPKGVRAPTAELISFHFLSKIGPPVQLSRMDNVVFDKPSTPPAVPSALASR